MDFTLYSFSRSVLLYDFIYYYGSLCSKHRIQKGIPHSEELIRNNTLNNFSLIFIRVQLIYNVVLVSDV